MNELARITSIDKASGASVIVHFSTGAARRIDFTRFAADGTVFEKLEDSKYASRCKVIDHGFALRWPDGTDMSAASILELGEPAPQKASDQKPLP